MVTSRQKLIPAVKVTGYRTCFFCFYVMASLFPPLGRYLHVLQANQPGAESGAAKM